MDSYKKFMTMGTSLECEAKNDKISYCIGYWHIGKLLPVVFNTTVIQTAHLTAM